ncbi:hypothetical protein QR680_019364 [Steinernema hermaphroditum]|uniref:non-specific serine/threonine protein kinase n=1 Tax=Steinernema hermaphroditum TaxID=289476 RepID=A0AA39GQY6_9BILA|nr:hypothetical protein QR680_019364 [Steinernema hermaphroditum]
MKAIEADNQAAQDEELVVLKSIFSAGELRINSRTAWNAWAPIDVSIQIVPTAHSNAFVSLVLRVVCPEEYPGKCPHVSLDQVTGLNSSASTDLLKQLNALCEERAQNRDPVITELCEYARDFLYRYNKKSPSDHEAMLQNKLKKETENQRLRAMLEQQEKDEIEEENALRQERMLAKIADREREDLIKIKTLSMSKDELGESFKTDLAPARKNRHQLCTEWIAYIDENQMAYVTEWNFEHTLGRVKKTSSASVDLTKFERDLDEFVANTLRRLRSLDSIDHSLYSYLFVHLIKRSTALTNFKCSLLIGQNIESQHRPLDSVISEVRAKSTMLLPVFASSAVCALKWLHDQHLYHGGVDRSSVWWHKADNTFRISDFFIFPVISKLANEFLAITSTGSRKSSSPPSETKDSLKNAQQRDLFNIGTLMMDMYSESASDFQNLPASCLQFIELCQQGNANADQLLDHEYLNRGFFDNLQMSKSTASEDPVGSYEFQKSSRLMSEWAMRKHLGGGGFGDVILAKNKVDGNDYAIKRIRLNPRSEALNRKITREAKLFSKLNHPNIVRYYNAWIENVTVGESTTDGDTNSSRKTTTSELDSVIISEKLKNVEQNAKKIFSPETTSEWTTSFKRVEESQESTEGESGDGFFGQFPARDRVHVVFSPQHDISGDSEFDILFEDSHMHIDEGGDQLHDDESEDNNQTNSTILSQNNALQVLYIQMEYCPKSTLRNLINTGNLFRQPKKVWRIFREILNGLQYIHHQGMVHRDIKPMNILLGINDQAKIGDFGLATRGDTRKRKPLQSECFANTSLEMTRDVGTMFYMAPELDSTGNNTESNEPRVSAKVDVYSTGIVLFEMFYTALSGMERVDVLKHLRAMLTFPDDFGMDVPREQAMLAQKLISWMLERNAEKRPTVDQILASDEVPLVEIEVTDFQKMFSQVITNKRGPLRKWAMRNLFEARPTAAMNYLYDHSICVDVDKNVARQNHIELLKKELSECFKLHAFVPLTTPSLIPYSQNTEISGPSSPVKAMDESGFVFTLPACLRRNFIRYCNRAHMYRFKRYTYGKTFHRTDGGLHPNERIVCAVDAVAQTSTVETMAAEMLSVTTSITAHLSNLKKLNWTLRIGHTQLIRAAMMHHGLSDEDLQKRVLQVLYMPSSEFHNLAKSLYTLSRTEKQNRLMHMCAMKFEQASTLLDTLEQGSKVSSVQTNMRSILRSKNADIRELAKASINELQEIMTTFDLLCAEKHSDKGTVIIDPTLCYRPELFTDGFVFQLEITVPKPSGKEMVVPVLAGGRYDKSLTAERHSNDPILPSPISAIGFNLYFEVLANISVCTAKATLISEKLPPCSAIVCCSSNNLTKEKYTIVQQLRFKNISTDILHEPVRYVEELEEHCRSQGIVYLLVVLDQQTVLVLTPTESDKGGVKLNFEDAVARVIAGLEDITHPSTLNIPPPVHSPARFSHTPMTNFSNLNFLYAMKMSHANRKKIESQARITMSDLIASFNTKSLITVCVCELPRDSLKQLASRIDRGMTVDELSTVFQQAGKMKQDYETLYAELRPLFTCKQSLGPIILYSCARHNDGFYKVLL